MDIGNVTRKTSKRYHSFQYVKMLRYASVVSSHERLCSMPHGHLTDVSTVFVAGFQCAEQTMVSLQVEMFS